MKGIPIPADMYIKSENFGGIIFVKCLTTAHRDPLIASMRYAPTAASKPTWGNIDQPISERTTDSILFALKRSLVELALKSQR